MFELTNKMEIRGRGLKEAVVKAFVTDEDVNPRSGDIGIRVEDRLNPSYWLHITLTKEQLQEMLAALNS